MENKQGFLSALKEKVTSVLSPRRSWRWSSGDGDTSTKLLPIMEGLDPALRARVEGWSRWVWRLFTQDQSGSNGGGGPSISALEVTEMMLHVMGAPLAPVHVGPAEPLLHLSVKNAPIETTSIQYIIQQYIAVSGGKELLSLINNFYAIGKIRMAVTKSMPTDMVFKNCHPAKLLAVGQFMLWQMAPGMWEIQLTLGRSKLLGRCNSQLVRHNPPYQGADEDKGPTGPLRRALQGLDPLTTANMFSKSQHVEETKINGEDCFVLQLRTDPLTLRSQESVISHILFGYFSQRTGLLIHLVDSHVTSTSTGKGVIYEHTMIKTSIDEYQPVQGARVARSGWSDVTVHVSKSDRSHSTIQMEEAWSIEDVAFNVRGLSKDFFQSCIPNDLMKCG